MSATVSSSSTTRTRVRRDSCTASSYPGRRALTQAARVAIRELTALRGRNALHARRQAGDRADPGQRPGRLDAELLYRAGGTGLGVEEPARHRQVDRARGRRGDNAGRGDQRRSAGGVDPVAAQRVAARVRDEVELARPHDPAERDLSIAEDRKSTRLNS